MATKTEHIETDTRTITLPLTDFEEGRPGKGLGTVAQATADFRHDYHADVEVIQTRRQVKFVITAGIGCIAALDRRY